MSRRHPNHRDPATLPVELRRTTVPPAVRDWVARSVGATVARVHRLPGASSSAVHRLDLADGRRVVLRRYVWPGFLEDEPIAPSREVEVLGFASAQGLPAPAVVAADLTGDDVGDGVPVVLMTLLPGRALAVPDLRALAEVAASIHALEPTPAQLGHDYFPWYTTTTTGPPPAATDPALWERAIDAWHHRMPPYRATLTHRDFHPGNVLWSRGAATGIVDWANGCRGPWGCDVAHCRANLIELADHDVADAFLAEYETVAGATFHPYWEIASVMERGPSHWTPPNVAIGECRLRWALDRIG